MIYECMCFKVITLGSISVFSLKSALEMQKNKNGQEFLSYFLQSKEMLHNKNL